jgi:hypothetical protein
MVLGTLFAYFLNQEKQALTNNDILVVET